MKALQLVQPKQWAMIDITEPGTLQPGEALVRVEAVGICGTDYGGYLGKMPFFSYPRIPGHELGVEVIRTADDVENISAGDRCCVEPYINCQNCHSCRLGKTNCCEHHQTLGVHCDGGLRPQFIMPARKLHTSPNLTPEQNALVETLAIGCHAVDRATITAQETVLVIGAGPIGLVSKSGTLTYQMMYELRDIGFSTAVGIGGDPVIGTTHIDCLKAFQDDPETTAIVMIGEIGGDAEERAAAFIAEYVTKPVVGYVAGFTAPEGKTMGHAGAIVSGSSGTAQAKKDALEAAGVKVGQTPSETARLMRAILGR